MIVRNICGKSESQYNTGAKCGKFPDHSGDCGHWTYDDVDAAQATRSVMEHEAKKEAAPLITNQKLDRIIELLEELVQK